MKNNRILPAALAALLALASGLILVQLPTTIRAATPYDDEFNSATLDPKWSWVNEDAARWSLTANPGYMRIKTQSGDLPPGGTGPAKNILVQTPPVGDFEIFTSVAFAPNQNYEQAGLLVYQDNNTFVKLVRLFADSQLVQFGAASGGGFSAAFVTFAGTTTHLRIRKTGTVYSGYSSSDGVSWTLIGAFDVPALTAYKIGVAAFDAIADAQMNADFDFFRLVLTAPTPTPTPLPTATPPATPLPSTYNDEFSSPTLDPKWTWIREDSARWSLSTNPGYMRIATQVGEMPYKGTGFVKNLLLQSAPFGDFEISTKVSFSPSENFQQAGLIAYGSDTVFVRLNRVFANGAQIVQLAQATVGWADLVTWSLPFTGTTTYLKLTKSGVFFTGYLSADGIAWSQVGQFEVPALTSYRIGIAAFNGWPTTASSVNADFDFFHAYVVPGPVTPTPVPTPNSLATAVAQLQQQAAALQSQVAAMQTPVATWLTRAPALQTQVATVAQQVAGIQTVRTGTIPAKSDSHYVADTRVTAASNITVVLDSNPGEDNAAVQWLELKPGQGFTINLTNKTKRDTVFTYTILPGS